MARARKIKANEAYLPNPRFNRDFGALMKFAAEVSGVSVSDMIVAEMERWWERDGHLFGEPTTDQAAIAERRRALAQHEYLKAGARPVGKVRAILDRVVKLDPRHVPARMALGRHELQKKRPDHAFPHFKAAAEAGDADAAYECGVWHEAGAAKGIRGKATAAREAYERALELDPRHLQAHLALARLCESSGFAEGAIRHLAEARREQARRGEERAGGAAVPAAVVPIGARGKAKTAG